MKERHSPTLDTEEHKKGVEGKTQSNPGTEEQEEINKRKDTVRHQETERGGRF